MDASVFNQVSLQPALYTVGEASSNSVQCIKFDSDIGVVDILLVS